MARRALSAAQRPVGEGERGALEEVGLADADGVEAERAAGLAGDESPGEDHVLAAGLDARQPAALRAGELGEMGRGRVDLGERQDVPLDEPAVVLGHAELVGHQRGVRAGDAHRAADRGAVLRRHGVGDGGGDVAREGRDLRRLRRIVAEEALGEPHHADVEAAHERRRLAGGADGELRAAAADVDEQERIGRGGARRAASHEVPPRKASVPSSSPDRMRHGRPKSYLSATRNCLPSLASRRTLVATSRLRAGP